MPYINDLIELSGIASNTTYTTTNGTIIGVVDGATYTGDDDNTATAVVELNNTDADGGILTIKGVQYKIFLVTPDGTSQPITLTSGTGTTTNVVGSDGTSKIAFIRAVPLSGTGPTRYFAALDDSVGDVNIRSLQTRTLDFDPSGSDVKISLSGNNAVTTEGNDTLLGGTGNDSLDGGAGNDHLSGGDGHDTLRGGAGNDTILGGNGNDRLLGGDGADSLDGGAGDDSVLGGAGADSLVGGEGNDTLDGDTGHDSINGDGGNDKLIGWLGNDTIDGGDGDDTVDGGEGDDLLSGGAGNDTIMGWLGNDLIHGGDGNDYIDAGASGQFSDMDGADTVYGGAGNDTILGGAGRDELHGGGDADIINGGSGSDTLIGDDGNDTLIGGGGADTLTGGRGNDTFIYTADGSMDTITDFNAGNTGSLDDGDASNNDFIDLSRYYGKISDLRADFNDDGILNQSNATDDRGRSVSYEGKESLLVNGNGGIEFQNITAEDFTVENTGVPCFTRGTLILTPSGEIPVESLTAGDLVSTLDAGPQPIVWIGHRNLSSSDLGNFPHLRPICIPRGALGGGLPTDILIVSPQHRVLVRSRIISRMFDRDEVLVAAKHLVGTGGIHVLEDGKDVEYWHIMLPDHQVITSAGALTESLYVGAQSLKSIGDEGRRELLELMPQLETIVFSPARTFANGRMGRNLAIRHKKNNVALHTATSGMIQNPL